MYDKLVQNKSYLNIKEIILMHSGQYNFSSEEICSSVTKLNIKNYKILLNTWHIQAIFDELSSNEVYKSINFDLRFVTQNNPEIFKELTKINPYDCPNLTYMVWKIKDWVFENSSGHIIPDLVLNEIIIKFEKSKIDEIYSNTIVFNSVFTFWWKLKYVSQSNSWVNKINNVLAIKDNKIYIKTKNIKYLEFLSDIKNLNFNIILKNEEIKDECLDPIKVRFITKHNILRGCIHVTFPLIVSKAWVNAIVNSFKSINDAYIIALINISKNTSLQILKSIKHIKDLKILKIWLNETKNDQWIEKIKEEADTFLNLKISISSRRSEIENYIY